MGVFWAGQAGCPRSLLFLTRSYNCVRLRAAESEVEGLAGEEVAEEEAAAIQMLQEPAPPPSAAEELLGGLEAPAAAVSEPVAPAAAAAPEGPPAAEVMVAAEAEAEGARCAAMCLLCRACSPLPNQKQCSASLAQAFASC